MSNTFVYLDSNATTQVAPEVVAAMVPFLDKYYGNPSSVHFFGSQVMKHIETAREQVATLLGSQTQEIVFTSCGSESNALAIRGVAELLPANRRHIITTMVEHAAVKANVEYLVQKGFRATVLGVDREGMLDLAELQNALTSDTGLVSIMYANNETGVIFPIEEIGKLVKDKGAIFHVDAVQAVGKVPLQMSRSTIDLLSLSGHKFHAPKGVGALYVRKGTKLQPQSVGGHQEHGLRAGTEAVPNLVALGVAAQLAHHGLAVFHTKVRERRDRLENWVLQNISIARRNGHKEQRLANTFNLGFQHLEGEAILLALSEAGICVSAGAACTSGSLEPSRILQAMHVPHDYILGAIRFSLSRYTTDDDLAYVMERLPKAIAKIQQVSKSTRK